MDNDEYKGTVLVTGGARGIGRAISENLAAAGYDLLMTYNTSEMPAFTLKGRFGAEYPDQQFEIQRVDFTDKSATESFADSLSDRDPLYGIVHNAGQSYDILTPLIDQTRAEELMQLNFWAMTRIVSSALRPMMGARRGRIIGIGSVTALHGVIGNSVYAASKGAMMSYMRTLAVEVAKRGICANYIAPGFVDTELLEPYKKHKARMEKSIPLGRFGKKAEIAALVEFLLSPAAAYMTGSVITMDGGLDAGMPVQR